VHAGKGGDALFRGSFFFHGDGGFELIAERRGFDGGVAQLFELAGLDVALDRLCLDEASKNGDEPLGLLADVLEIGGEEIGHFAQGWQLDRIVPLATESLAKDRHGLETPPNVRAGYRMPAGKILASHLEATQ